MKTTARVGFTYDHIGIVSGLGDEKNPHFPSGPAVLLHHNVTEGMVGSFNKFHPGILKVIIDSGKLGPMANESLANIHDAIADLFNAEEAPS
jgi:hypothetical protein